MAGRASLITNNPLFSTHSPAGLDLRLLDDSARAVLICARDLVHKGWRLANHPLYGNFRPHQQPYRSLVLLPCAKVTSTPERGEARARQNCPGARNNERAEKRGCGFARAQVRSPSGQGRPVLSEDVAASAAHAPPQACPPCALSPGATPQGAQTPRALQSPTGLTPVDPASLHFLEQALLLHQSPASHIRQSRPEDLPEIMRRDCALLDYELLKATLESLL